jgi:uncharacterized membrane protein YwzB
MNNYIKKKKKTKKNLLYIILNTILLEYGK